MAVPPGRCRRARHAEATRRRSAVRRRTPSGVGTPSGGGTPSGVGPLPASDPVRRPIAASGISVRFVRLCRDFTWLIRASRLIGGSIALRINLIARINHASREDPGRPCRAGQETVTGRPRVGTATGWPCRRLTEPRPAGRWGVPLPERAGGPACWATTPTGLGRGSAR